MFSSSEFFEPESINSWYLLEYEIEKSKKQA